MPDPIHLQDDGDEEDAIEYDDNWDVDDEEDEAEFEDEDESVMTGVDT